MGKIKCVFCGGVLESNKWDKHKCKVLGKGRNWQSNYVKVD